MGKLFRFLVAKWRAWDLVRQFLLASTAVVVAGMALIGYGLSHRIEDSVTQNTALATALYVDNFVGPRIQGLAGSDTFQPAVQDELERLLRETSLGQRIVSIKVWAKGGKIIYASRRELIGERFPPTPNLRKAWTGAVAADLDRLEGAENAAERETGLSLLEIYVPIRKTDTDTVIAVVEFYEDARRLKDDILAAKLESWLMLGGVGAGAVAVLFGVVAAASRMIERQRRSLVSQIQQLSELLAQNQELRRRLERSSRRAAEINERYLRRIGSDLHDGPAQLLSLALLRLDTAKKLVAAEAGAIDAAPSFPDAEKTKIRSAISDALHEIRSLSMGLSLPELELLSLADTIREAVRAHLRRTGKSIAVEIEPLPASVSHVVKATAFRFVQEGLNNATRHGGAAELKVSARREQSMILVEVCDAGPGFTLSTQDDPNRLGLAGLRERLESAGGSLTISSAPGRGTCLSASLPIEDGGSDDA